MVDAGTVQGGGARRRLLAAALLVVAVVGGRARDGHAVPVSLANRVVLSPDVVTLANPTSPGGGGQATSFTLAVRAHDVSGRPIEPSEARPLVVELQGARDGVITPRRVRLTSGSTVTFQYDGSYFADPLTLVAWLDVPPRNEDDEGDDDDADGGDASAGRAIGRARVVGQNAVACSRGSGSHTLRVLCTDGGSVEECALNAIRHGLRVHAAVGWNDAGDRLTPFTVDTGSIGTIVPRSHLGPDAIGPGPPGRVYYDSSGRIFSGHYYLAPVSFAVEGGGIVKTPPMLVLAIDEQTCAESHPSCRPDPDPQLHYLGVGFARGAGAADGFVSPADNAFLRLAEAGGDVSPGYVLTGRGITIGIPSTDGYTLQPLAPSTTAPGDWSTAPGCFAFPDLPEPNQFCGNFLLDVGLLEMFLDLAPSRRPEGSAEEVRCRGGRDGSRCTYVPEGTRVQIVAGTPDAPAMSYEFALRREPVGPEPTYAQWIDREAVFVNVGRRPLFRFHYMVDARCGNVGFARVD